MATKFGIRLLVRAAATICVGLVSSRAHALTRCEVMDHAKTWIDAGVMYSQGPGGGYCAGSYYCDPYAGGQCYRPDCSGFVSAVWGLPPPGHTTYYFAGGVYDDGVSHVISASELQPGDALNFGGNPSAGTGHIMLFGGWLDGNGKLWAYQENLCGTAANYTERTWDEMAASGYVPIRMNGIEDCGPSTKPTKPAWRRRGSVDVNGDGIGEVCGRAADAVYCVSLDKTGTMTTLPGPGWSDASGWTFPQYYTTIQYADIDGDGKSDICARGGLGIGCHLSDGSGLTTPVAGPAWSDDGGWDQPKYYTTIQFADVNGDGKADLCGRSSAGIVCAISDGAGFTTEIAGPGWGDADGWDQVQYYSTIQFGDINGDGKADVCARGAAGIGCSLSNGSGFPTPVPGPEWSDANGWDQQRYYSTIQFADVNGDGKADLCGRAATGIVCALSDGDGFSTNIVGPPWSDDASWDQPQYNSTIQFADVNGDGKSDVCARASGGIFCSLSDGNGFPTSVSGPEWSDANGWDQESSYSTINFVDLNQDGKADVCGRGAVGIDCKLSDGSGFPETIPGPGWSNEGGWDQSPYNATLTFLGTPRPKPPSSGQDGGSGGWTPGDGLPPAGHAGGGKADDDGGCALASPSAVRWNSWFAFGLIAFFGLLRQRASARSRGRSG